MKKLMASLFVGIIGLSGCAKESKPGGPGAAPKTDRSYQTTDQSVPPTDTDKSVDPASMFTLKTRGEVDLKRGERKEVTVSIDRGAKFNQSVKLQFKAAPGLKITPAEVMMPPDEKEVKVNIEAEADAPGGEASIEVIGVPETGRSTSVRIPVEVHVD
jgi:hypothetical protein